MLDYRRSTGFLLILLVAAITALVSAGLSAALPDDEGTAASEPPACASLAAYAADLIAVIGDRGGREPRKELLAADRALSACIRDHGLQR